MGGMEATTPLHRAERIAARQHGAIDIRQAIANGLTHDAVEGLARRRRWIRAVPGVYRVAGAPDSPQQRLLVAFLAVRTAGGVVSHLSAAAVWGLGPAPFLPQVTVPPDASGRCRAAKVVRSEVALVDRAHRQGLVVTSVSRTIADVAGVLDRPSLTAIVDDALCRKLASSGSVDDAMERLGRTRAGKAQLRAVLAAWTPGIEPGSPAEVRLLRLASEVGIAGLVPQHVVRDERGQFVARLDLADPVRRRALEYDGVAHHGPRAWDRDESRYARLRALGWDVESVTKLDLGPGEPRLRDIARRWGVVRAGAAA
jgi:hypothetical protein